MRIQVLNTCSVCAGSSTPCYLTALDLISLPSYRSNSEFRYRWVREGRSLPDNAILSDHNRVLVLREAKLDDQGIYTCHVVRDSSADQKSLDLRLGGERPRIYLYIYIF